MYAIRNRLDVKLITENLGGKGNYHVQFPFSERHRVINGRETVDRFASEIEYLDFSRIFDHVETAEAIDGGFRVKTRSGSAHEAKSLIIATGAMPELLDVPGERQFMMRGLGYSAVSYAHLCIDHAAAVVGDGELAVRSAADLSRSAKHVYLIAEGRGALDSPLGERLQAADNVTVMEGFKVDEVKGDHYAKALVISRDGEKQDLAVDAIFVELSLHPASGVVADLVDLDANGRIKVDSLCRTSRPGVFAAGDVTNVYAEQVLVALGDGAKAALSAQDYLLSLPD
jgi:thioredoxin reductase